MQTQTQLERDRLVDEKVQELRELYADAPELGRAALEKGLPDLKRELAAATGDAKRRSYRRPSGQSLGAYRSE